MTNLAGKSMSVLSTASQQWMSRPDDERYTSLLDMQRFMHRQRDIAKDYVVPNRKLIAQPISDDPTMRGLRLAGANGNAYDFTHWSFGQLANLSGAPAGYLRKLPAPLAADNLNYGLRYLREVEDVGVLMAKDPEAGTFTMRCATGPNYGRVWNADIVDTLVQRFGDGISGDWRVPGEFGKAVVVDKSNTTLYASDRDMFVFLADETNRIEIPNRRDGKSGSLARGFYVGNSEVGAGKLVIAAFFFDFVCMNRNIWGVEGFQEISIRHSSGAPERWLEEAMPVIKKMSAASDDKIIDMVKAAQEAKLDDARDWMSKRFTANFAGTLNNVHMAEEGRPVETLWDVNTAITAHAKSIPFQNERIEMERLGGKVLELVAA